MNTPLYKPPTKVVVVEVPFKALVVRADPDYERDKRWEPFYETSGRTFYGNNQTAGPYSNK